MTRISVAKTAGYCYGVRRAVEMALDAAHAHGEVYTAGPLIHNKSAVEGMRSFGVHSAKQLADIPDGAVAIVRAHGLQPQALTELAARGCTVVDATCPHVSRIHRIVEGERAAGRTVLVIGKHGHPEVEAIAARAGACRVAETEEELYDFLSEYREQCISVVVQTTFRRNVFNKFLNIIKKACNDAHIFDTICKATDERQEEACLAASGSDVVIVIGDKASSNSKSLYELCREQCETTLFIETASELPRGLTKGARHIFITAGASTPDLIIKEVNDNMTDEIMTNGIENFAELLEQSLKTLHTGEKVTGIVTAITPTEIHVDLGVKQAGYISTTELSDDPSYVLEDNIHVGDEIDAFVLRVNDVEGLVMLSKKRLDAVKNWEKLEAAVTSEEPMNGMIVEQNKGGIVANVLGIRVFIPASQTGLPREATMDGLMRTMQKIRITEVNRQRRRVVGSIKALLSEQRREAAVKVWETIAVGNKYKGIVKSFTSYGAFVDIGGVDGMVHISELSWNRVRHPSDVLTLGQQIEVNVIALDMEKKKISLGYRQSSENPWAKFESTYNVGDVVKVKVVKFMPFGAFAEVLPGVDGLIHISQIANRRIAKADEALTIGQEVEAQITDIDSEKNKISLSIRALLDGAGEASDAE